jgi:transcriptional regulator with XRE-family HTH domain
VKNNFEKDLERIGQKIKEIRLAKKLTQSSLASSCDVDIRTIQRIEKGTFNMSLKILYSISEALGIIPSELLINKESENKGSIFSE